MPNGLETERQRLIARRAGLIGRQKRVRQGTPEAAALLADLNTYARDLASFEARVAAVRAGKSLAGEVADGVRSAVARRVQPADERDTLEDFDSGQLPERIEGFSLPDRGELGPGLTGPRSGLTRRSTPGGFATKKSGGFGDRRSHGFGKRRRGGFRRQKR